MIRATYADFQPEIARVAGVSGMQITDPRVMSYTNVAIFELMNEGDWPSVVDRLRFKSTCGRITLPSDYDRMLYCTVDRVAMQMQSPWFEFVGYGDTLPPGLPLNNPIDQTQFGLLDRLMGVLDRDDVATFNDVPCQNGPFFPAVYGTVPEGCDGENPFITILGYDANKQWIRSQVSCGSSNFSCGSTNTEWIDGVRVEINGASPTIPTISGQTISEVTAIIKPPTNGYVHLYAANESMAVSQHLATYAPKDTTPFYRRYEIPALRNTDFQREKCVVARLRKRFVKITCPSDFLLINSLPALTTMVQAIYYREAKDIQNYAAYKQVAVDILRKEMKAYLGLQRTKPLITFGEGLGVRQDGMLIL